MPYYYDGQNTLVIRSIHLEYYHPQCLIRGRIRRGVDGNAEPLTKAQLMRRRQRLVYAHYVHQECPPIHELINQDKMRSMEPGAG